MSFKNNIEINKDEDYAVIKINPEIFSLEVIYSAAYTYLDKAYFIIDGDPEEKIQVKVKVKDDLDLKELTYKLQNELINYSVYVIQASRNQEVRNAIINRALATNRVEPPSRKTEKDTDTGTEKAPIGPSEDADYIDDSEGIAEPWSPEKAEGLVEPGKEEDEEEIEDKRSVISDDSEGIAEPWSPEKAPDSSESDVDRKIQVDRDKCIGCGTCTTVDPETFKLKDGKSSVKNDEISEETKEAESSCPVDAIEVGEE